jgi:hypothetical protein
MMAAAFSQRLTVQEAPDTGADAVGVDLLQSLMQHVSFQHPAKPISGGEKPWCDGDTSRIGRQLPG